MQLAIFLLLLGGTFCHGKRVIVNLANGGTSRPLLLQPLQHNHDGTTDALFMAPIHNPVAAALKDDDTIDQTQDRAEAQIFKEYSQTTISPSTINSPPPPHEEAITFSATERITTPVIQPNTNDPPIVVTSESPTPTAARPRPSTPITLQSSPSPAKTTKSSTAEPSLPTTEGTVPDCHISCLASLNATRLYSNESLVLPEGSEFTLICELPLHSSFILENLIWLFHPDNSPERQCSLTNQEFIPSCGGFHSITNTDDRNGTFLRDIITISNILTNQTGQYLCQVQLTCCPSSHQHVMGQERILHVTATVWTSTYTADLIIVGTITGVLALIFVGVSIYFSYQKDETYITISSIEGQLTEKKTSNVLQIPLIEEHDDDDSFDSTFEE